MAGCVEWIGVETHDDVGLLGIGVRCGAPKQVVPRRSPSPSIGSHSCHVIVGYFSSMWRILATLGLPEDSASTAIRPVPNGVRPAASRFPSNHASKDAASEALPPSSTDRLRFWS